MASQNQLPELSSDDAGAQSIINMKTAIQRNLLSTAAQEKSASDPSKPSLVLEAGDETSLSAKDESLDVAHGSERLEASFGRFSISSSSNTAARDSDVDSSSLSQQNNNNNNTATTANSDKQREIAAAEAAPSTATGPRPPDRIDGDPDHLPSPPPAVRAYMLEYKNEPRPPPSAPRTPLSLSLLGLRRAPLDHSGLVVASEGDYFADNPLLSPKLEAIDEVTEEMSVQAIETPPASAAHRRAKV